MRLSLGDYRPVDKACVQAFDVFFDEELEDESLELGSFISISIFFNSRSLEELELEDVDFFDVELDEE